MRPNENFTPIINIIGASDLGSKWCDEYMHLMRALHKRGLRSVESHKAALGRQNTTFVSWQRYWVWETLDWQVWVNNGAGVSVNVPSKSTQKEAFASWRKYRRRMNAWLRT